MTEHFPDSPAPYRPLKYAEAWQIIAETPDHPDYQLTLTELTQSTQVACAELLDPPDWSIDPDEVILRWRLATEEVIQVAVNADKIDTADDVGLLKQALDIIRDNTLDVDDGTGWQEEGLAFPVIDAVTEEERIIDLRNMISSPDAFKESRLVRHGRSIFRKWDAAGRPGLVSLVFQYAGATILAGGLIVGVADEVFDLHLADKAASVDIMPDSPWPARVGQATIQCIGLAGGSDRDVKCRIFEVIFGDE